MSVKVSKLYGIDIYTDEGAYIGKVHDVILNMEKGEVVRITTEPLRVTQRDHARKLLQENTVLFKNVRSVGDILIVGKGSVVREKVEDTSPQKGKGFLRR